MRPHQSKYLVRYHQITQGRWSAGSAHGANAEHRGTCPQVQAAPTAPHHPGFPEVPRASRQIGCRRSTQEGLRKETENERHFGPGRVSLQGPEGAKLRPSGVSRHGSRPPAAQVTAQLRPGTISPPSPMPLARAPGGRGWRATFSRSEPPGREQRLQSQRAILPRAQVSRPRPTSQAPRPPPRELTNALLCIYIFLLYLT